MTEDEARSWIAVHFAVSRETLGKLDRYRELVAVGQKDQNLVGYATHEHFWSRHIVDSAQLALLAPEARCWLDIGSGAGLPGLILAILTRAHVTLVEPRNRRAAFLSEAATQLNLLASIYPARVQSIEPSPFDAITARALAPLTEIFTMAEGFAQDGTIWVLPKGRGAQDELAKARASWQGEFRIVPSVTDRDSGIVVASHVRARK